MNKKRKKWTTQEKELLKKIYPTASWDEMIKIFQANKDSITHKAKNLRHTKRNGKFCKI